MKRKLCCVLLLFWCCFVYLSHGQSFGDDVPNPRDERRAWQWYTEYQRQAEKLLTNKTRHQFNYVTHANRRNWQIQVEADEAYSEHHLRKRNVAEKYDWREFNDQTLKKLFTSLTQLEAHEALPNDLFNENRRYLGDLQLKYGNKKLCVTVDGKYGCYQKSDLESIMKSSTIAKNMVIWNDWHDQLKDMKSSYLSFISLENTGARLRGSNNVFEAWLQEYEWSSMSEIDDIMERLRPFYQQLHAYVRHKLLQKERPMPSTGHIPAHLFDDLDTVNWANHDYDPYFNVSCHQRMTDLFKQNKYTVKNIASLAESFYTSLGLPRLQNSVWAHSVFEDPTNIVNMKCTGASWDIEKEDRCISMCGDVSRSTFTTLLTLFGFTHFFKALETQLFDFRFVPNIAVASSLGGVAHKSVLTTDYLQRIGLIGNSRPPCRENEADMNMLMMEALSILPVMNTYYVLEKWRQEIFRNDSSNLSNFNKLYWDLRCKWQGVSPPTKRPPQEGFDAASFEEITSHRSTLGYLISYPMTYEWYKSFCGVKGHTGELHKCNLYQASNIGPSISNMLILGKSHSWRSSHQQITGRRGVTAEAMLEYFEPLNQWLRNENIRNDARVGWDDACASEKFRIPVGAEACVGENEECDERVKEDVADWVMDLIRKLNGNRNNG